MIPPLSRSSLSSLRFRWRLSWWLVLLVLVAVDGGCGNRGDDGPGQLQPLPERPLRKLNSAVRRGQWDEAWRYGDAVLAEHPDDAEAIATVARVAHEVKEPERAAELLVAANRAESFRNEQRVQQAMIAMIGVGRLHDGMQMLEEALRAQPNQHETRRWLYDFYMGTENRTAGLPHGRRLVRERKFDLPLLMSLSNTERRTQDAKPLTEMTTRNPDDKRPLLGEAKTKFDLGEYDAAIKLLQTITAAHPEYLQAQTLLGQSLAAASRFDEMLPWAAQQTPAWTAEDDYWIAIGDWARGQQQWAAAARAYWEATRRDPDVMESWSKLNSTLQQLHADGSEFPPAVLSGVQHRVSLLSEFNQAKNRFERTGSISRALAVDIIESLVQLGRLWEAEAWSAVAMTLPEDDSVAIAQLRQSIVDRLHSDTPWQLQQEHPELQIDLAYLSLPAIGRLAETTPAGQPAAGEANSADAVTTALQLVNEAGQRGLNFFGRTSDDLDQAGIMLYETLGCGGATLDYDLDGFSDLYLVAAGGTPPKRDSDPNALFRNLAGQFSRVDGDAGAADTGFGQGVAVGDVNEDGFPDLLVLNYGPNTLWINNGDGTFQDVSDRCGALGGETAATDWSTSGAIADLDGDGISDLVIVNYCAGLDPVTTTCPMEDPKIFRSCTPVKFAALGDVFLRGGGDGTFADVSDRWGIRPAVPGRGLGITVGQFDDAPGNDVFVANDMTNNHFWNRQQDGDQIRFAESAMLRGLGADDRSLAQGSMGIASGDLDHDGDVDFYVTNFHNEYNTYHQGRGGGMWQDQTARLGLSAPTMPLVGFGTEAIDLDNDRSAELVVTNGHVDIFSRGEERSVYAQPLQIFRRSDDQTFESIGQAMSGDYVSTPHVGRALWSLDVDRDGRQDIAVTHQTEPVALLINHTADAGNWLRINLRGRSSSRDCVGAVVTVSRGDESWTAFQTAGDGYLCSSDPALHFGLGDSSVPCTVQVQWPSGEQQVFRDLQPNENWLLIEGFAEAFR